MTRTLPILAAAACLGLAACGEPLDGSDTADLEGDAVTAGDVGSSEDGYNPAEDGMLQTDAAEVEDDPDMVKPENEAIMDGDGDAM